MTEELVMRLALQAIEVMLLISAPVLGAGLIVGVLVSMFQIVTSIQDMTLSFIPRILAVFVTFIFVFPWMMNKMIDFTSHLITSMPTYIR